MAGPAHRPSLLAAAAAAALLLLTLPAHADKSITIAGFVPYQNLHECARECVWHVGAVDDLVAAGLGCPPPWMNECLCRVNLATSASSFITSCCSSRCTTSGSPDGDITAAVGVYNSYCGSNGFEVTAGAVAAAAPTGGSGSGQTGGPATGQGTVNGQPTETGGSSSTGGTAPSSSPLSTPALIGVIVSVVCSVLGLVFGVVFKVYTYKREKKRAEKRRWQEQQQQQQDMSYHNPRYDMPTPPPRYQAGL